MSESHSLLSEPVSPITMSGERSSMDWAEPEQEPEPNVEEGILVRAKMQVKQVETSDSDFKDETSTIVDSIGHSSTSPIGSSESCAPPSFGIHEKLGTWNLVVTGVGSIYSLLVLGFLWFLWTGQDKISFWRWLVVKSYVQTTVTLSSAILRTTIGAQSSLATSMLAAIVMETLGFSLKRSAFLSIQRANGGLPFTILEIRHFLRHAKVLLSLIVLLCLTTIAAYFTSTALIADFALVSTPGYMVDGETFYSISSMGALGDEPIYSNNRPSTFPVFAEYSEAPPVNGNDTEIDDTGPIVRAILPISSASTRENLGHYTGYATLLNSHVVCVKPIIEDLKVESRMDGLPLVSGQIAIAKMSPGLIYDPQTIQNITEFSEPLQRGPTKMVSFLCEMSPPKVILNEWPLSICIAGNRLNYTTAGDGTLQFSDFGRLNNLGFRATSLLNDNILLDPLSYVMVNYSGVPPRFLEGETMPYDRSNSTVFKIEGENFTEITSRPMWRTFEPNSTFFPNFTSVSITYCFSQFSSIDALISANSSTPRTEPALTQRNTSSTFGCGDVVQQLGADGLRNKMSLNDRGILSLQKADDWSRYSPKTRTAALDGTYGFGMTKNRFTPPLLTKVSINEYLSDYMAKSITATWGLGTNSMAGITDASTLGIHWQLSSIFQTSLRKSGSPATALQALFTVVNMMQYYDRLPQFDLKAPTSISLFEPVIQPRGRWGLIAVTIGLMLHLSVVIAITVLFHFRTNLSFVGQSWQAVAQLQNENAITVLQNVGLMRDAEVEKWMKLKDIDGNERFYMGGKIVECQEMSVGGGDVVSLRSRGFKIS